MAWITLSHYVLTYDTQRKQCHVHIAFREGGSADGKIISKDLSVDAPTALFLADLLRNEGPVSFDPDSGILSTTREQVGEGES